MYDPIIHTDYRTPSGRLLPSDRSHRQKQGAKIPLPAAPCRHLCRHPLFGRDPIGSSPAGDITDGSRLPCPFRH